MKHTLQCCTRRVASRIRVALACVIFGVALSLVAPQVKAADRFISAPSRVDMVAVTAPANGSAAISGRQVRYTPRANFTGTDSFTYTVSDGRGGAATARVTVTVARK